MRNIVACITINDIKSIDTLAINYANQHKHTRESAESSAILFKLSASPIHYFGGNLCMIF